MTCFDRQEIERVTAIQLDACGRIPTVGEVAEPSLKGLADALQSVQFTRNVDVPAPQNLRKVNGGNCSKPRPAPTDNGISVQLTFCGINPVFESLIGYKTLDLDGSTVTGWEDAEITTNPQVALEIIFTPTADSCAAGTPACYGMLIPSLEQWVRSGDELYNGADTPDLVVTGTTALNANLFDNYTGVIPAWLDHWDPKEADIATGRSWAYNRLIPCPTADTNDACVLVAI